MRFSWAPEHRVEKAVIHQPSSGGAIQGHTVRAPGARETEPQVHVHRQVVAAVQPAHLPISLGPEERGRLGQVRRVATQLIEFGSRGRRNRVKDGFVGSDTQAVAADDNGVGVGIERLGRPRHALVGLLRSDSRAKS